MSGISSPRSWRPDEVRRKQFTVRFRGLDPNEVHGFLNALADDLARLYEQLTTLTQDNARLRNELQQAQVDPQDAVSDQAILLLDQAQQLADALIEEGMQSARDMMVAARSHQRVIVDPSLDMDHGAGVPGGMAGSHAAGSDGLVSSEVEEARMFAKVAQVQFRAVLDALNEQVNRLGQVQGAEERDEFSDQRQFTSNGASPFDRH